MKQAKLLDEYTSPGTFPRDSPLSSAHCSGPTCLRKLKAHVLPASLACGCEQVISPLCEEQVLPADKGKGGGGASQHW